MKQVAPDTILIVEDDSDIRTFLSALLELEGFKIRQAANGHEGLKDLESEPTLPSLIILDLMMPVMDGWKFRENQIAHPEASSIPVVLMTAEGHAPEKAAKMGAQGCIQKPVNIEHLLKTIHKFARAS